MRVTLEVKSGMSIGRRYDVQEGTRAVFGRSRDASHVVEHDPRLAERHFSVAGDEEGWHLRSLSESAQTFLNGEPVQAAVLAEGDRIKAGNTVLQVTDIELTPLDSSYRLKLDEAAAPAGRTGGVASEQAGAKETGPRRAEREPRPEPDEEKTGPELLEWLGFDEEIRDAAKPGQTAADLLASFEEKEEWPVALRLRAHLLEPRDLVLWGRLCLEEVFGGEPPEKERAAFDAAAAWLAEPTEENRRAAEKQGPAGGMEGLAAFLCAGAFYSGGSIAPEGNDEVLPDPLLPGQLVFGVLMMAAPEGDPAGATARHERFSVLGREVAEGKHLYPEPSRA